MDPSQNAGSFPGLATNVVHDLSIWGLFWQADIVVKAIMLMLLIASVWCWAIIIDKSFALSRIRARSARFDSQFWSGGSLEELAEKVGKNPRDPKAAMFAAAMEEWRHAIDRGLTATGSMRAGLQQRVERVMSVVESREMGRLERGLAFLASVGSSAPFIGLFGTVWGIMNAFTSIANSANTSLSVVAPGIAEALFATALGLFAAVPATIGYNRFATLLGRYGESLDSFAGEFSTILSRHLEERG